jgi:hypothetical protein
MIAAAVLKGLCLEVPEEDDQRRKQNPPRK